MSIELTPVRDLFEAEIKNGVGRNQAAKNVAKTLETSRVSVYRWLKDDMHYVSNENGFICVYKLVKLIEIEGWKSTRKHYRRY